MRPIITTLFLLLNLLLQSQDLKLQNELSALKVSGTSSLHDWHLDAKELSGEASLVLENGNLVEIKELSFAVEAEQLLSGKKAMDKNTFKALKTAEYPEIKYEFVRVISQKESEEDILIKTGGKLTIAGRTNSIYMDVVARVDENVSFKGSATFKMSDYGIEPPIALMGAVKTGDEITIEFNVKYY